MNYKYISIERIFSKLIRDVGDDFDEQDVIEWIGEALEFIGATRYYEEHVAFVEVSNHQCDMPTGTHNIIQIARNHHWDTTPKNDQFCPKAVVAAIACDEDTCSVPDKSPDYIILDCNGQPLNDYDIAYYRPFYDWKGEYFNWKNSNYYHRHYSPVRLATGSFFSSLVCQDTEDQTYHLHHHSKDEYQIIQGKILRFSFKDGHVAIAHNRQVVDTETGYPLVPDNISYITAVTKYIILRMMEKDMYKKREGSSTLVQKAEADWQWYCGQASNVDKMPCGIDEHQNLLDQRSYILPRNGKYFGFFGRLAEPEHRRWNDPDHRNTRMNQFQGH